MSTITANSAVAETLAPLIDALIGTPPVRITFWDGSELGPPDPTGTLAIRSPDAVNRILWAPGELGVARAFVSGDIDVEGDIFEVIRSLRPAGRSLRSGLTAAPAAIVAARRLHVFGAPLPPPPEEAHQHGVLHSRHRDATAIHHHYDVGNDFYRLVLGESMTYSCARFLDPSDTLEQAQAAKHELICAKLGLHERPAKRLLDVGCGWGSMAIHAARHHGAQVVGITISHEQAAFARERVTDAGLDGSVTIRVQDYRDIRGERFDAISSIGMFEHVGSAHMSLYLSRLHELLKPTGRLLNHAISSVGGSRFDTRSFTHRYVFPDGELIDVGQLALAMEKAGFEVRDVESLREHYAQTLHKWVRNLTDRWDEAVALVGEARARVWLLYMAASAIGFEDGGIAVHQTLGVVTDPSGASGMPSSRRDWG